MNVFEKYVCLWVFGMKRIEMCFSHTHVVIRLEAHADAWESQGMQDGR